MRGASLIIVRLVLLVAVLLLWEALPRLGLVNAMLLPPLSDVLAALGHILGRADVHTALGVTAAEVVVAFVIAGKLFTTGPAYTRAPAGNNNNSIF